MRLYAILFALLLILLLPTRLSSVGRESCGYEEQVQLELYELQQRRIAEEKARLDSLERYTDIRGNLLFLDTMGVNFNKYVKIMAHKESRGNYRVVNRFGYMGRYQFGRRTLLELQKNGILSFKTNEIQINNFLENKVLQEAAMCALTAHNIHILNRYGVLKLVGTEVGGVRITTEGLLAGCHLRGPLAVKQFLATNGHVNKVDGNGTSVRDYIAAFS